ncbi:MAG: hypothetical protein HYV08_16415 [Deltaproteobacteria bacterium]|nr:hypothetical protein [Deltaproteobacteria bacterium]MBI3079333.1 hypothetical protein [Deltaproteobacteria bacterium]
MTIRQPEATGRKATLIYSTVSVGAAALFAGTSWARGYPGVAVWGGAAWVLLLSFIITMPLVSSLIRSRQASGRQM